ncbi:hypothetical protein, partial [Halorubrum sp. SP9]
TETGVAPADRHDTVDELAGDEPSADTPYRFETTDTRGWTDEVVDDIGLGWAPIDRTALFEHLWEEGFKHHTMIATGLFHEPDDVGGEDQEGRPFVDYTQPTDESSRGYDGEKDAYEPLECSFKGHFMFPYRDEAGRVAYFIGRRPDWSGVN